MGIVKILIILMIYHPARGNQLHQLACSYRPLASHLTFPCRPPVSDLTQRPSPPVPVPDLTVPSAGPGHQSAGAGSGAQSAGPAGRPARPGAARRHQRGALRGAAAGAHAGRPSGAGAPLAADARRAGPGARSARHPAGGRRGECAGWSGGGGRSIIQVSV